ncbi:hypothetical protein FRC16_010202 [Serendipita sp. 398]|nr:hypothetical protein FRC16_010202 [Serendipita sp. 398]
MISSSLVALVPFVLTANALLFEPPSATVSKRNTTNHRRVADAVGHRGHARRGSGDQWVAAGCRTDNVGTRALPGAMTASDMMTNDACKDFCDQAGFSIAATEWSRECWCDNEFHFGDLAPAEECNYMCTGNGAEVCGGPVRMTVWVKGATVLESHGDWSSKGCFVDSIAARIVPTYTPVDAPFTPERCLDRCSSLGYSYAGLEYMHECYCANGIDIATLSSAPIGECNALCDGDPSHYCGAGDRLLLYQNSVPTVTAGVISYGDWSGQGCYTDSVGDRALPTQVFVDGDMTIEKCTAKCLAQGFPYAGVEYAHECFCGASIGSSGSEVTGGCNMPCSGANDQNCGGGNRLNVFHYTKTLPSTTASSPIVAPASPGWTYQDCYTDETGNRALGLRLYLDGGLTAPQCMDACFQQGYEYAGVEYGDECYCGRSIGSSGTVATDGCTMACSGDATTLCGGPDRLNVYRYTNSDLSTAPTVLEAYKDWSSKGCYVDSVQSRVLTGVDITVPMTVETCIDTCANAGYTVAGIEYGSECYCGAALPPTSATDNCIMRCSGDSTHLCGGANRLNVYEQNPAIVGDPWAPWVSAGCRSSLPYTVATVDTSHSDSMTIQMCTSYCDGVGASVAVLSPWACTCTSTYSVTEATTCTTPCKGDDKQMCGGSGGVSVYYKPSDQVPLTSPVASNVWQNQGCYSAYGPTYVTPVMDVTDFYRMDVEKCTGFCFAMGKPVAAISSTTQTFGGSTQERQVSCGDVLPSTPADDSSCNKSCTANRFQYCGGQTTYSIYKSVAPSTTFI